MKASEARAQAQRTNRKKQGHITYKVKLAWHCGIANHGIEKEVKKGGFEYSLKFRSEEEYRLYADRISRIYRDLGYSVYNRCNTENGSYILDICWRSTD